MADPLQPLSRAEREAHRALLEEALAELPTADDPERAASEVMRALDSYIEATGRGTALTPREPPVTTTSSGRRRRDQVGDVAGGRRRRARHRVVAIALSGGWPAGGHLIAIWVLALVALLST